MKTNTFKNYKIFKIIQLILLVIFFIAFFVYLKTDPVLSNNIFTNTKLLTICVFLWAFMIFSFISVIFDLSQLEKSITDSHDLNRIAYLDPLTGIPNRQSCDLIFSEYTDSEKIKNIGIALISISNLQLINDAIGRDKGTALLQKFAVVFEETGDKYGFVGRNGGNEFLIMIEKCTEEKMQHFLDDLSTAVRNYNETSNHMPVTYKYHTIYNAKEHKTSISEIISLLYKEQRKS